MEHLRKLLTPPVFPDEEQTRIARLLHWLLLAGAIALIFDAAILAIFAPETLPTFWINGLLLAVILLSYWVMRRGLVRTASLVLCLSAWITITYYLAISGGVTSPAFGFLTTIIIAGAVLLGAGGAGVFGLLSIVTAIGLLWAGNSGWLTLMETPPTPSRLFATQTAIFLTLAILMGISGRNVQDALMRARRGERDLAERNRQLRQEITERERAQQEQARLAAILEATSDLVGFSDKHGKILYLNQAGRRLAAINPDDDISQTGIADYHPPEIAQLILNEAVPHALRDGIWSGETILLSREGREIPVSQVIIVHRSADGIVEYLSTIMRDISEHKRAEHNRLELAVQKERLESFKEFLATISHDLKTPMSVINTSLYLLERLDNPKQRKEKIANIEQQMILLEHYIQDLLTLTRLDRAPELTFITLDLNRLLRQVQSRCALLAESRQVSMQLELDATIPPVLAEEQELYRALVNLVENALQYTPGGGSVVVKTYPSEDGVITAVSDTGVGIAREELPNIFERFYRSEGARQLRSGGTGLGLAIVKRIVDIHKGNIEVESTLGAGTTFRVWLPASSHERSTHNGSNGNG